MYDRESIGRRGGPYRGVRIDGKSTRRVFVREMMTRARGGFNRLSHSSRYVRAAAGSRKDRRHRPRVPPAVRKRTLRVISPWTIHPVPLPPFPPRVSACKRTKDLRTKKKDRERKREIKKERSVACKFFEYLPWEWPQRCNAKSNLEFELFEFAYILVIWQIYTFRYR